MMRDNNINLRIIGATLMVAESVRFGALEIFPILARQELVGGALVPLPVAVEQQDAKVTELARPLVEFLQLENHGARPVVAVEGLIVGALAQNRLLGRSVIAKSNTTVRIPVFCCERHRWATAAPENGAPSSFAAMTVRRARSRGSRVDDECDSQGRVWDCVENIMTRTGAMSNTSSLLAVSAKISKSQSMNLPDVSLPEGSMGVAVVANDRLLGGDVFGSPDLFAAFWPGILEGLTVDATVCRASKKDATSGEVQTLLRRELTAVMLTRHNLPRGGGGKSFDFVAGRLSGAALFYNYKLVHVSFFRAA